MSLSIARLGIAAGAIAIVAALGGCTRMRVHQGYIADPALTATVQPGVDNRDSVQQTLGRPSFVGEFDPSVWYYVSRDTRQLAFGTPKPIRQTVLAIHFDAGGSVASVERTGVEKVVAIRPSHDKTPTLGRNRGFFAELFGNIGQVGSAGTARPSQDNPQGQ